MGTDRWLDGHTMAEIAPNLFKSVLKRTAKRTVAQALHNRSWVQDIKGARTVEVLLEFLHIWDMVDGFILQPEIPDRYRWKLTQDGAASLPMRPSLWTPSSSVRGEEFGKPGLPPVVSFSSS
jgi:hypothetical protein